MVVRSTASQGAIPRQHPAIWRLPIVCCAGLVALLLLLQPIFCIAACVAGLGDAQAPSAHTGHHAGLLCHIGAPVPARELPTIPAFWPGTLPALLAVVAASPRIRSIARPAARIPTAHRWSPPLPPPRPCAA
jgi:hypothetical protein